MTMTEVAATAHLIYTCMVAGATMPVSGGKT